VISVGFRFSLAEQGSHADIDGQPNSVFEPKLDGLRAFLVKAEGKIVLINRRERNISEQFPEVIEAALNLPDGVVLDGEITVPTLDGEGNCPSTASRSTVIGKSRIAERAARMPAIFACFDLLFLKGRDIRREPFEARRGLLHALHAESGGFFLVPQMMDGELAWKVWVTCEGGEGIMMKDLNAPYTGSRSGAWIKIKAWAEADFLVLGFTSQEREVSTLCLSNGHEVNCPRANEGTEVKEALARGDEVTAVVKYLPPYRFPILREVRVKAR